MKDDNETLLNVIREAIRGRGDKQMSPEAFESWIIAKIKERLNNIYIIQSREHPEIFTELFVRGDGSVGVNRNRGMSIILAEEKIDTDYN